MMDWYYYIAIAAISLQGLFLVLARRNYRYALAKYKKKRASYRPRTALLVPCKGLDANFQKNITSLFDQDYEDYSLCFVVEDTADPAYDQLCKLKNRLSKTSRAHDVQVLVAGQAQCCSQKIHNLLHCYKRISDDVEVLAFADSDICVRSDWLSHLAWPLRQSRNGAASGYRWFIPKKNNLASLALSAANAKIAQLLGHSPFNQAWGGSMAIRADVFRRVGLDKIWSKAFSDDLSLTRALKKAGMRIAFVPACLAPSYQSSTWRQLFEFGRRQFLITRVNAPWAWCFALCSNLCSALGLWVTTGLAIYAAIIQAKNLPLFVAVPIIFFASQLIQAVLRQNMIRKLLNKDLPRMKAAMAADILAFWIWSLLLLFFIISSAFGRTVCWRGIRYKLLGPNKSIVIDAKS
jgi:cellulose synthase/poly-beta-1,6-N-acetylglucosamine synthase-like glycosyltransferase